MKPHAIFFTPIRLFIFALLMILLWVLLVPHTYAATGINRTINFQGKLVDKTAGTNVADGTYDFTFRFYNAASAGTQLPSGAGWEEDHTVTVTDGIFRVTLGSVTPIPTTLDFNDDSIYLEMEVETEVFDSRVRMTAVPYAFNAEKVTGLDIESGKTLTVDNSLTFAGTDSTTITFQGTDTYVGRTTTDTLTNKTIGSTGLTFSGAAVDITTATNEHFSIMPNGAGNVGIGTTAPTVKLEVVGSTLVSGTATMNGDVILGNANADTVTINAGTSGTGIRFTDSSFASCGTLTTDSSGDLTCGSAAAAAGWTDGGTDVYLTTTTDFVGIGTTDPTVALHVTGSAIIGGTANLNGDIILGDASGDSVTVNAATWTFANDTNVSLSGGVNGLSFDASTLSIDASNNRVGVGTTAPTVAFEVNSGNTRAGLRVGDASQTRYIELGYQNATNIFTPGDASSTGFITSTTDKIVVEENFGVLGTNAGLPTFLIRGTTASTQDIMVIRDQSNVDLLNLQADGDLGLGTSAPTGRLQVVGDEVRIGDTGSVGTATGDGDLYIEDALEVDGATLLGDAAGDSLTIAGSSITLSALTTNGYLKVTGGTGTVGVGTTIPTTDLSGTLISTDSDSGSSTVVQGDTLTIVGGTAVDTSLSGDSYTISFDSTEVGTTTWGSGSAYTWTFDSGATDPSVLFGSNQMAITAGTASFSGRLGIGTTAPTSALTITTAGGNPDGIIINGAASNTATQLLFQSTGTARALVGTAGSAGNFSTDAAQYDLVLRTAGTSNRILFNANGGTGTSTMAIKDGLVGIGTTNPGATFDVVGNARVSGTATLNGNVILGDTNTDLLTINAGSSGSGIRLTDSSFASCSALETDADGDLTCGTDDTGGGGGGWTDGTNVVYLTATTDSVGIGTTAPTADLHIVQTTAGNQSLVIDAAATDSTSTAGVFDLNVDTVTNGNIGLNLDYTIRDAAGNLSGVYGQKLNLTVDSDASQSHTAYGLHITADNDDATSTTYGLFVDADGDDGGTGTAHAAAFVDGDVLIGASTLSNLDPTFFVVHGGSSVPNYGSSVGAAFIRTNSTTTQSSIAITSGNAGAAAVYFGDVDSDNAGTLLYDNATSKFHFMDSGNYFMTIQDNGTSALVGIGNTAPGANLDVAGASGSALRLSDGTFASCTALETDAQGDVTCGTDDSGGGGAWTDGGSNVYLTTNTDFVGIGTTAPTVQLEVAGPAIFGESGEYGIVTLHMQSADNFSSGLRVRKRGSGSGVTAAVASSAELGYHEFYGWDGSDYGRGAYVIATATEAFDTNGHGTSYGIYTTPNNSTTSVRGLFIDQDQSVEIGDGGTVGTATGNGDLYIEDALEVDGAVVLGDATGDTVTFNADGVTFALDTNVTLSGGVAGLNFDTNTLSIDGSNNRVGIGTTAPAEALEVVGNIRLNGTSVFQLNTNGEIKYDGAGALFFENASTEKIVLQTITSGDIGLLPGGSDGVGIGTTNPGAKLDVTGASGSALRLQDATFASCETLETDAQGDVVCNSTAYFAQNGNSFGGAATLGTNDNYAMHFETNGAIRMSIRGDSGSGAPADWLDEDYGYRKLLTIDSAKVSGSHTDFPVLVSYTDADLKTTGNGGKVTDTQGDDIIFADATGSPVQWSHEVESYNATTGQIAMWVEVPNITSAADTEFYIYYGNGSVTSSTENAADVWSDYTSVYHFNGDLLDSVGGNNGTNQGTADAGGLVANGRDVETLEDDRVDVGTWSVSGSNLTMQIWYNAESFPGSQERFISKAQNVFEQDHVWMINTEVVSTNDSTRVRLKTGTNDAAGTSSINASSGSMSTSTWHQVTATYDGSNVRQYIDGSNVGTTAKTGALRENTWAVTIGGQNGSNSLDGLMDEVRIGPVVRDANWLTTEYNNLMNQGATTGEFIESLGTEEDNGGGSSTTGFVGIGTTSPGAKLEVTGASGAALRLSDATFASCTALETDAQGDVTCGTDDSGGGGVWTDGTNVVYLTTSTDNVGIGTTNPGAQLELTDTSGSALRLSDASFASCTALETDAQGDVICGSDDGGAGGNGWTDAGTNVYLSTITDDVGIGNTAPLFKLHFGDGLLAPSDFSTTIDRGLGVDTDISGEEVAVAIGVIDGSNDRAAKFYVDDATAWWGLDGDYVSGAPDFSIGLNGLKQLVVDSSGDVGIGNTAPGSRLTVYGDVDETQLTLRGSTAQTTDLVVIENGFGTDIVTISSSGYTEFQNTADSTQSFRISDSDGGTSVFNVDTTNERVGIGTESPGAKLDVTGASGAALRLSDATFASCTALETDADGDVTCGSDATGGAAGYTSGDGSGATSSGSGMEDGTGGIGLLQGCSDDQILVWNDSSAVWECGSNRATFQDTLDANWTLSASVTETAVDNGSGDDMAFPVGTSETWIFQMYAYTNASAAQDMKWSATAPTGATCDIAVDSPENTLSVANLACGGSSGVMAATTGTDTIVISGTIVTNGTSGEVQAQFGQGTATGTSTVMSGSYVLAFKVSGADLAETYYTSDTSIDQGTVVSLDGTEDGVKKTERAYDANSLGVVSTRPGMVLGDPAADPRGRKPVYLALSGRVPVKVNLENGPILAGDYLTTSSTPGVAMRANKAGAVIGQALVAYNSSDPEKVGTTMMFAKQTNIASMDFDRALPDLASTGYKGGDVGVHILGTFLTQKGGFVNEAPADGSSSVTLTDRVIAGIEVISPRVIADGVETNSIKAATEQDLTVNLSAEGAFVLNDSEGNPVVRIDDRGNAFFAGTLTADKIKANQIEGLKIMAEEIVAKKLAENNNLDVSPVATMSAPPANKIAGAAAQQEATSSAAARPSIFAAVTEFLGKVFFRGPVEFEDHVTVGKDTAGYAVVKRGEKFADVVFEKEYESPPVVNASLNVPAMTEDVYRQMIVSGDCAAAEDQAECETNVTGMMIENSQFAVSGVSPKGFVILLAKPATIDTRFSWNANGVREPETHAGWSLFGLLSGTPEPEPTAVPRAAASVETGSVMGASSSASLAQDRTPRKTLTVGDTGIGFLRIRESNSVSSREVGQIPTGESAVYSEEKDGWYRIEYKGTKGWVSEQYVEINGEDVTTAAAADVVTSTKTVTVIENGLGFARLRSEPSISSTELDQIPEGAAPQALERRDGWVKVTFRGQTGWVSESLVK